MKAVCVVLLCLATIAYAYFDEELDSPGRNYIARRNSKQLSGGYTFITEQKANGKFKCECLRSGKKVWSGMCGVKDKSFSYSNCE